MRGLELRRAGQRPPDRLIVFLAGFLASPSQYSQFLSAVARAGDVVIAPRLYRPSPSVLLGRFSADDEANLVVNLLERLPDDLRSRELWLTGHSRGGQSAWLAAGRLDRSHGLAGVVVVDPVDGSGPRPRRRHATVEPATFASPTLVVGAGLGGRCAPAQVNHDQFARNGPSDTTHVVIPTMGHADLLDDRAARAARVLCRGGAQPARERASLAQAVREFMAG